MEPTVAVHDLRVGMFVCLELGWMRHPFPLSSFRIASPEQIATIRALGLERVRWEPEKSDPIELPAVERAEPPPPPEVPATLSPQAAAAQARREALAAQRAAQRLLENQYSEASAALRQTFRRVREQPQAARADAEALARALLDKLLVDGEMCVRVLNAGTGERAAAHGLNVAVVALLMGRSFGLDEAEMLDLGIGALMHDLGKIDLPDRVRHLDDDFSTVEVNLYREHVPRGVSLGRHMGLSEAVLGVMAQHHEHADGTGFPQRLAADRTSLAARMVSLVDRYDNLCNPAVLGRALTPHESLALLFSQGRSRFDATILNAFIRMMGVYPAGSVVQLTDDRYATVVAVNSSRPLKPRVLVHDPRTPRDEALMLDLETASELGIRRSLSPAKLPAAAREYLAPAPRVAYFFEAVGAPPEAA